MAPRNNSIFLSFSNCLRMRDITTRVVPSSFAKSWWDRESILVFSISLLCFRYFITRTLICSNTNLSNEPIN